MRTIAGAAISYTTKAAATGTGQRSYFFQGEVLSAVLAQARAVIAELGTEQGADWEFAFVTLGGGGAGGQFVLELRAANDQVAGITANGYEPVELAVFGSQGAQALALAAAFDVALADFVASYPLFQAIVSQFLLTGASQGTPVSDVAVAGVSAVT